MKRNFFGFFFVFLLITLGGSFGFADPAQQSASVNPPVAVNIALPFGELSIGDFISHYQTAAYFHSTVVNEMSEKLIVNINPRWRIEGLHWQGKSPMEPDTFQTSVDDYEWRLAVRLDDWRDQTRTDRMNKNIHGWISWKTWSSNSTFITVPLEQERDEGLGFGVERDPEKTGWSYFYSAGLYPSVRTSVANQRNAFSVSAGPSVSLGSDFNFNLGYRYQAIRTDAHHARGQEQGLILGLSARF